MMAKVRVFLLCIMISGLLFSFVNSNMRYIQAYERKIPTPEVTVAYTDNSYDVPASTSTNPYTGKPIENPAYHVENKTLRFTIDKNTPKSGNLIYFTDLDIFQYEIQMKGAFSEEWCYVTTAVSDSATSITTVTLSSDRGLPSSFPSEGKVDFRIRAFIRSEGSRVTTPDDPMGYMPTYMEYSDWSKTQTIILTNLGVGSSLPQLGQDSVLPSNQLGSHSERTIVGFTLTVFSLIVAVISLTIALISISLLFVYRKKV